MTYTAVMNLIEDRIAGALLGVHAGDALGATVEFMSWSEIRNAHPVGHRDIVGGGAFKWKAGSATDDTDLTRAVLLGYRDHFVNGADITHACADWMVRWQTGDWPGRRRGSFPKDIGHATAVGLRSYQHHRNPTRSGAGQGSAGNGSLMRCIATGVIRTDETIRRTRVGIDLCNHPQRRPMRRGVRGLQRHGRSARRWSDVS
jgi:ADP-ribosylglycohydrolase